MAKTKHVHNKKKCGPRIPALYGSWATEICRCGAWRVYRHKWSRWRKTDIKKELIADEEY